ncbi:type I DNA topoisomerase [Pacificimonas flava]|uniref:DNA topoisomerase 1 n=1 Tax=Pacificimonas flava TaxID=1234595 RepID=M2TPP4_9SPHN|nr:type I DNA topoisomerase [Pacificimonas flava]EMD83741.1 DNA topoisomerase I [Pacificimonas flava]MBB5280578.1 DNA topoisomerase-1 [Pacificimonas flava]
MRREPIIASNLVIVESPAKAKTINKYLGSDYEVLASYGHVRDLPPKDGSVDPDADFAMKWQVQSDRSKQLKEIAEKAKKAGTLILATDPDREGEAISWHLYEHLKSKKALPERVQRVTFNQITKNAVSAAMAAPRDLDGPLVEAYLARRALDYLVGFTLSPVLWRKLPGAKSAGRVQSVALRLITEREREIEAFRAQEYWTVKGQFETEKGQGFEARLVRWQGKQLDKFTLSKAALAAEAKADVLAGEYQVAAVETKPVTRNPYPPFTTSTLQQEASRKLGISASDTMRTAQALYEAGYITYMRTDGVEMAGEAIAEARAVIKDRYSERHVPASPRVYKSKAKNAQEAHEAIRPVNLTKGPEQVASLPDAQRRLYDLVWKRTLASQMASAKLDRTTVLLQDKHGRAELRASGQVTVFPGFLALYQETRDDSGEEDEDDRSLPKIDKGSSPAIKDASADQHFTQPPPRYSEASLVKQLEELGIGRPSTYASILQVLKDRDYVVLEQKRFKPEEKGRLLTAFLERFFERYVEYDFTAGLEGQLDEISAGDAEYKAVLRAFWQDFFPKTQEIMELKPSEVTEALDEFLEPFLFPEKEDGSDPRACPSCENGRLALRGGKFGPFIACSNYPDCKYTRPYGKEGGEGDEVAGELPKTLGAHPEDGEPVSLRSGRFGLFVQHGEEDKKPPRASIPRDIDVADVDLAMAVKLLSLPRIIGQHPETGKDIEASIGRYGPYLRHDGKYARLTSTAEVFETGMNAAVVKLAEAAEKGGRKKAEPLKIMGAHPVSGEEIRLMEGRYGPYVTDGTTNASLKKDMDQDALTLEQAATLIDERAAKAPAKKKRKAPAKKKAATKKTAAKKTVAKGAAAKKTAPKKKAAAKTAG